MLESLFNKVAVRPSGLPLYQKETPTQIFSCEISQIFKSTFSYRTPPVAASGLEKTFHSCHFNIFGVNHRCFRKIPNKKDNE